MQREVRRKRKTARAAGLCHLPVALMRGVHLLKPQGFHKREAHRSFPIQRIGQIGTLQAVTFGKRAYASFLRGCRFQQERMSLSSNTSARLPTLPLASNAVISLLSVIGTFLDIIKNAPLTAPILFSLALYSGGFRIF